MILAKDIENLLDNLRESEKEMKPYKCMLCGKCGNPIAFLEGYLETLKKYETLNK